MKYFKYALVMAFALLSFYVSDQVIMVVESMSPIMKEIKANSPAMRTEAVNAVIDGNTIIVGKNGYSVNERESYLKMNDFGTFNETFYVYDAIKPEVSLYDHLDKIIVGSSRSDAVAIITDNKNLIPYLREEKIAFSSIIYDKEEITDDSSYINGNATEDAFMELNAILKRKKLNNKICLVGYSNLNSCRQLKYFLVSPTMMVYSINLAQIKATVEAGKIYHFTANLTLAEAKVIIQQIKYKDLKIIPLAELISEE